MTRVLVLTRDIPAERMAGPAVRAWECARALSAVHDVRLVSLSGCERQGEGFASSHVADGRLGSHVSWADVIVMQGDIMGANPQIEASTAMVIVDLYDPFPLEQLEQTASLPAVDRRAILRHSSSELARQLARGDAFMCASERQRDLWLGALLAAGRINPVMHTHDPSLRSLIDVVPFGLSPDAPSPTRSAVRGAVAGIANDDRIVVWGGGIYNWFDPVTLVRAIDHVRDSVPNVRLWFMATKHPNPGIAEHATAIEAESEADRLGLTGTHVFFNREWVPFDERADVLCDADVAVSTHGDHLETRFAFRTRVLDYLWAGLPMVLTEGDSFADLVQHEELGRVVPAGDVEALAHALVDLLANDDVRQECAERVATVAKGYHWVNVLKPVMSWCDHPQLAPDRSDPLWKRDIQRRANAATELDGVRGISRTVQERVDRDGFVATVQAIGRRLGRMVRTQTKRPDNS